MKKFMNKLLHPGRTKLFWLYIVGGVLLLLLAVMLMPIWSKAGSWAFFKNWGLDMVHLLIALGILLYLFGYLLHKIIKRCNGVIKTLTIIEFVLLALVAVGCILQQFKVINVGGACSILGLALWCRGTVEIFRAYYHQKGNDEKYPLWWLAIAIFFVTFGAYIFANPLFPDLTILWIFDILLVLLAIMLIVIGGLARPLSSKK